MNANESTILRLKTWSCRHILRFPLHFSPCMNSFAAVFSNSSLPNLLNSIKVLRSGPLRLNLLGTGVLVGKHLEILSLNFHMVHALRIQDYSPPRIQDRSFLAWGKIKPFYLRTARQLKTQTTVNLSFPTRDLQETFKLLQKNYCWCPFWPQLRTSIMLDLNHTFSLELMVKF